MTNCNPQKPNFHKAKSKAQSLYRSTYERDACGVGLVAQIDGEASHQIVQQGLQILRNLEHRGAIGGDGNTGDGAGISLQLKSSFVRNIFPQAAEQDSGYAVAMLFLHPQRVAELQKLIEEQITKHATLPNTAIIGWRQVPHCPEVVGKLARDAMPAIFQLGLRFDSDSNSDESLDSSLDKATWRHVDAQLYFLRRKIELSAQGQGLSLDDLYFCSFSSSLIVYKGMFTAPQLQAFYPDLQNPELCSAYALVHQRYSTNTLPQWYLAHPFRQLAHNGEINTIEHNLHSFAIREANFDSPVFGSRVREICPVLPVLPQACSDSAGFDGALEFLLHNGRSLAQVLSMMVPEPFGPETHLSPTVTDYYDYHSMLMEAWDGPAAIVATTGHEVTAILDRNGLRPLRFSVSADGRLILASEAGVLPLEAENIVQQGKISPGKLLSVDLEKGLLYFDRELKEQLATEHPYRNWLCSGLEKPQEALNSARFNFALEGERLWLEKLQTNNSTEKKHLISQLRYFTYSYEDLCEILAPMAELSSEPIGSMASPIALAALLLNTKEQPYTPISSYFRQIFAQVTNPPIDPYREVAVMSLRGFLGSCENLLQDGAQHCRQSRLEHPLLNPAELARLEENSKHCTDEIPVKLQRLSLLLPVNELLAEDLCGSAQASLQKSPQKNPKAIPGAYLKQALQRLSEQAEEFIHSGATLLLLSDRGVDAEHAAIPALLALGAVQEQLQRKQLRHRVSLGVESGELFSIHHFASAMAYGANFLVPYLAFHAIAELQQRKLLSSPKENVAGASKKDLEKAIQNYSTAIQKGLLKVMSKMGVSTMQSYQNSRLYEILGLGDELVQLCFPSTPNPIRGKGFAEIECELAAQHALAWQSKNLAKNNLAFNGSQRLRRSLDLQPSYGRLKQKNSPEQRHSKKNDEIDEDARDNQNQLITPMSIVYLQQAVRNNDYATFRKYTAEVDSAGKYATLRGLLRIQSDRKPIPLAEVEGEEQILRRFVSGAMSYGSLSKEAHEAIAIAMNRIGGRSNSGEGGEDPARYQLRPNGDNPRSRIKQIASGRFGVSSHYLANADEIQIKMAQGAKPGEGGQLPGGKIDAEIARVRNSIPGVTLISPPPHHDIYSIEDLAQLIYDLRSANPEANISVKLVAKSGVGTVASGVAKGKANSILISGHDGGTGASPLSSLMHAGSYWELGLAETQQSLRRNHLRERVRIQCDGQLKTGRDVLVAGLLGAEEFGFGTSCLIALGCIMMRKCHTNSCPVGIATQDKRCRELFAGLPDHVENMMRFIAHELREWMADLGYSRFNDLVGRADLLQPDEQNRVLQSNHIDLKPLLNSVVHPENLPRHCERGPELHDPYTMEPELLRLCQEALGSEFQRLRPKNTHAAAKGFYHERSISNSHRAVGATISYHISKNWGAEGLPDKGIHLKFRGIAGQSFGAFSARGLQLELEGQSNDYFGKGLSGARLIIYPFVGMPISEPSHQKLNHQEQKILVGNVCLFGATSGSAYIAGRAGERFAVRNSGATAVVEGIGAHGCEYMTGGRVIVLGPTGLNFAAGMSGGIAYVWDLDGQFAKRCNMQQVELDAMNQEAYSPELAWLKEELEQHLSYTSSPVAQELLANWSHLQSQFVRVIPHEYKRVLQMSAKATA